MRISTRIFVGLFFVLSAGASFAEAEYCVRSKAEFDAAYSLSGTAKEGLLEWITGKTAAMQPAVLLITDGEIWDYKKIVARAKK